MSELSEKQILDGPKRFSADKLAATDQAGRNQSVPLSSKWNPMTPSNFSYNAANRIDVSNINVLAQFLQGDKLKIKQTDSNDYKYFQLVQPNAGYILIAGGDNYSLTDNDIIELYMSREEQLIDWPLEIDFVYSNMNLVMIPQSGIGSSTNGKADCYFKIGREGIEISYETTTSISTSGNAINSYLYTQIPSDLIVPSGNANDQVPFPSSKIGFVRNTALSAIGMTVLFYASTSVDAGYEWPDYVQVLSVQYGTTKFGNAGGSSSMSIIGGIKYSFK
jgi:hypothetical protein